MGGTSSQILQKLPTNDPLLDDINAEAVIAHEEYEECMRQHHLPPVIRNPKNAKELMSNRKRAEAKVVREQVCGKEDPQILHDIFINLLDKNILKMFHSHIEKATLNAKSDFMEGKTVSKASSDDWEEGESRYSNKWKNCFGDYFYRPPKHVDSVINRWIGDRTHSTCVITFFSQGMLKTECRHIGANFEL